MKVLIHAYNDKRYVQQKNVSLVSFNICYADYRNYIIHSVMLEMGNEAIKLYNSTFTT